MAGVYTVCVQYNKIKKLRSSIWHLLDIVQTYPLVLKFGSKQNCAYCSLIKFVSLPCPVLLIIYSCHFITVLRIEKTSRASEWWSNFPFWLQCHWALADLEKLSFACECLCGPRASCKVCSNAILHFICSGTIMACAKNDLWSNRFLYRASVPASVAFKKVWEHIAFWGVSSFRGFERSLCSTPHSSSCSMRTERCAQMCHPRFLHRRHAAWKIIYPKLTSPQFSWGLFDWIETKGSYLSWLIGAGDSCNQQGLWRSCQPKPQSITTNACQFTQ